MSRFLTEETEPLGSILESSYVASLLEPAYRSSLDTSPNNPFRMAPLPWNQADKLTLRLLEAEGLVVVCEGRKFLEQGYKLTTEGVRHYQETSPN